MKTTLWMQACLLAVCLTLGLSTAHGGLEGTAHDFSDMGWSGGQVCAPCHTPHNADTTVTGAPLWNHSATATTYTLYSSPTLSVAPEQPRSNSKLCLSCHDGTVALDSFGGRVGTEFMGGAASIGVTLADDHPVSIKWQHQNEMSNGMCAKCHSVHPLAFVSELPFFDGYVECASCHDVHGTTPHDKLLRKPLTNGEICQHCHGK